MNLYDFFIIFASALAIIMVTGLLMRPLLYRSIILSIILIIIGYFNLFLYCINTKKILDHTFLIFLDFIHIPLMLLLGPLIYFYILSITQDKNKLNKSELIYFLPSLILTVALIPYIGKLRFANMEFFLNNKLNSDGFLLFDIVDIGSIALFIIYSFISIKCIIWRINSRNPVHQKILILLILVLAALIIGIIGVISVFTYWKFIIKLNNILISLLIISIYLLSQRYPYLIQYGTISVNKRSQSKSRLLKIDVEYLNSQLGILMNEEKFYCDEDLTLKRLSDALEITSHQLSEFLNEHYKKNFNSFINCYRINEAKGLLLEEPSRNTLSIAYSVGFNSYSTFHASFKKETGMSPADFRRLKLKINNTVLS